MMELSAAWTIWAWIGWLVTTFVLVIGYVITGYIGMRVFTRIKRVYALHVVAYWLDRFEREGKRTFEKA
jgi:hypothetical protein